MSSETLNNWLQQPWGLFIVMLLASAVNGLTQFVTARRQGTTEVSFLTYWTKYWPETVAALLGNILCFAGLVELNQLNFASALGIGFGVNVLADLLRTQGRSASLSTSTTIEEKQ